MSARNSPILYFEFRYSLDFEEPDHDRMLSDGRAHVDAWLKQVVATEWIYQYEITEGKKDTIMGEPIWYNPHLQGYLKLKDKCRLSTLVNGLPPSLKGNGFRLQRCSTAGLDAMQEYCMKEESRCGGPWGHKFIYIHQDLQLFEDKHNWYQWQMQLTNKCVAEPDDRTIEWIWDPNGGSGKSKWAKWMVWRQDALVLNYCTAENLRWTVVKEKPRRIYILDATRASPKSIHKTEFYSALENIKNGMVMSGKYEGGIKQFMPPHVIVLSNAEPDWELWSKDRLKIWNLTDPILMMKGFYNPDEPYEDPEGMEALLEWESFL